MTTSRIYEQQNLQMNCYHLITTFLRLFFFVIQRLKAASTSPPGWWTPLFFALRIYLLHTFMLIMKSSFSQPLSLSAGSKQDVRSFSPFSRHIGRKLNSIFVSLWPLSALNFAYYSHILTLRPCRSRPLVIIAINLLLASLGAWRNIMKRARIIMKHFIR